MKNEDCQKQEVSIQYGVNSYFFHAGQFPDLFKSVNRQKYKLD